MSDGCCGGELSVISSSAVVLIVVEGVDTALEDDGIVVEAGVAAAGAIVEVAACAMVRY